MNAGAIWWGQIGNSLRFLTNVTNALRDCHSAVLQVPQNFPWRQDFYEAFDIRRSSFSGERRLVRCQWKQRENPGEFVLHTLCSDAVRSQYWPGKSYAAYLAEREDIVLNDYYVWITGIHTKTDIVHWMDFAAEYVRLSKGREQRAVFVLEYDGEPAEVSGIEKLVYSVEDHDCRVFCLETAAALKNTDLPNYQAELALCIGNGDPQLSAALLSAGEALLREPVKTALTCICAGASSDGKPFPRRTEQEINSSAWKAAIVLLFPLVEHYRMCFVNRHETELSRHLPISNSNGDRVTDPYDLEIGAVWHIVSSSERTFSAPEVENVRLCRKLRNLLAHNKPAPYDDVVKILSLV